MANFQAFDELISGIQQAIVKSQELTQTQHIALMEKYFDKHGNPLMIEVKIPSLNSSKNEEKEIKNNMKDDSNLSLNEESNAYRIIKVPVFSLIPHTSLVMEKIKMDFNVKLVNFNKSDESDEGSAENKNVKIKDDKKTANERILASLYNKDKKEIITNIFANENDQNSIHVELEFVNKEPLEGVMRVNDMMIRMVP